jgi:hypothetical protein
MVNTSVKPQQTAVAVGFIRLACILTTTSVSTLKWRKSDEKTKIKAHHEPIPINTHTPYPG